MSSKTHDQIDALKQLLAEKIGLHVPPQAHERFIRMVHEQTSRHGFATLDEYRDFLLDDAASGEWEEFIRHFTSGETFFFRDHGQFDLLRLQLLPELIARHRADKTLRFWSSACASGEEAYSLAMLVDLLLPERSDWNILILGTDIDSRALAKARQGRYSQWSFRLFPASLQQRYFHQLHHEWQLDKRIRDMVSFDVVNLVDQTFPDSTSELHDMDLILCRNVFIYFQSSAVLAVASKLADTLVDGGYLVTAHTELMNRPIPGLQSRLFSEGVVYQRSTLASVYPMPAAAPVKLAVPPSPPPVIVNVEKHKEEVQKLEPIANSGADLYACARQYADRGEYQLAEQMCRQALTADPLQARCYFLLAQLAQLQENLEQAKDCLNKALYLDDRCVAAYLELAILYERSGDTPRAQALRLSALNIVLGMPKDERIEEYETTAGELARWLAT